MLIEDEGMKGSFDAIAGVLNALSNAEEARQTRMAAEEIVTALGSGDENAINNAVMKAATFKAKRSPGLQGILQAVGAAGMTGGPGINALQQVGIPIIRTQADIAESKARQGYYGQGGRSTQNTWVRDARGNARQLKPGEQPRAGEEPFRPDTELTDVERDKTEAELESIFMGQRDLTKDPKELADINANLSAIRQRRASRAVKPAATQAPAATPSGQVPVPGPTAAAPGWKKGPNGEWTGPAKPAAAPAPAATASRKVRMSDPNGVPYDVDEVEVAEATRNGWRQL
ncbi:MAG: hypothetical protein LLG01_00910 [Planctomycetaceae bacterium]|nr:hypothetical protein [Planctomycetaceae bacterium]